MLSAAKDLPRWQILRRFAPQDDEGLAPQDDNGSPVTPAKAGVQRPSGRWPPAARPGILLSQE